MGIIKTLKTFEKDFVLAFNLARGARKMVDAPHGFWPDTTDSISASNNFRGPGNYLSAAKLISWANVCCSKIGKRVAMTPWDIYDADDNPAENSDLNALFSNPNPFMTFFAFVQMIEWHLLLAGNAYIYKAKANAFDLTPKGKYSQLWLFNPGAVEPLLSEQNYIEGYRVNFGFGEKIFPTKDIIHIKEPNPIDDRIGMGKIQANEILYNTEYSAAYYNWQFFAKGGRPDTALVVPADLNAEQVRELEARFDRYRGVRNSHKIITLTGGMDVKDISMKQKDMEFIEQRKFSREEILAIFEVPPAEAGVFEYANYANSKEQKQMFLENTIEPRNRMLAEAFTSGIVHDFDPNLSFAFDTVVRKDEELYMKLVTQGISGGALSPNEGREYLDLPPSKDQGMDGHYIPINWVPISDAGTTPPPTPPANTTPGKGIDQKKLNQRQSMYRASLNTRKKIGKTIKGTMKSFFSEQESRVLAALNNQKAISRKIIADDIFDYQKELAALRTAIRKGHTAVIVRAIQDGNEIMGTNVDASTENPKVTARIGALVNRSARINDTTMTAIQDTIKEGVDAGESIPDLAARVSTVFDQARGYRAEMIARTESAAAYDKGSVLSYMDAGVEVVDVIGCEDDVPDCNAAGISIELADQLTFHPNHTGVIVPA